MDGRGLTEAERRSLNEIETRLREESAELDRDLRTMAPGLWGRLREATGLVQGRLVVALGLVSLTLLAAAIRTSSAGVIWAFAICWTSTLICVFALLCAMAEGSSHDSMRKR
ncbi:DUF3040 domain-containing protein [Streptomyces humicola]|uniref:DUF3040 domain-containing protein n=1 Tax=Streptomyces humicola TaxID=2953240 RepID=UPI0035587C6C